MNKTTGDVATALSIADLVSLDSRRALTMEGTWKTGARGCKKVPGRESGRNAFFEDESGVSSSLLKPWDKTRRTLTDENAVLENMFDKYFRCVT